MDPSKSAARRLLQLNAHVTASSGGKPISKLLVANRGEIAIRIFRAAKELGIPTVAIYAEPDKESLHVSQADESFLLTQPTDKGPIAPYLNIPEIIRVAKQCGANAIHPVALPRQVRPDWRVTLDLCAIPVLLRAGPSRPLLVALCGERGSRRAMGSCRKTWHSSKRASRRASSSLAHRRTRSSSSVTKPPQRSWCARLPRTDFLPPGPTAAEGSVIVETTLQALTAQHAR
jgi:hypothetical protein